MALLFHFHLIARFCLPLIAFLLLAFEARAGAPFTTDDSEPTEQGGVVLQFAGQYTQTRDQTSGALPAFEADWGAAEDLQLIATAPLSFSRPSGSNRQTDLGDAGLGAKYRFVEEDEDGWRPGLSIAPQLFFPTGKKSDGVGTGREHVFLPLWTSKNLGEWKGFGGGGYQFNPGAGNKDGWYFGAGATRKMTDSLTLGTEVFHATALQIGGKDTTGFNIGGIFDLDDRNHVLFSAGRALQNPDMTNRFTMFIAYQLTF